MRSNATGRPILHQVPFSKQDLGRPPARRAAKGTGTLMPEYPIVGHNVEKPDLCGDYAAAAPEMRIGGALFSPLGSEPRRGKQ